MNTPSTHGRTLQPRAGATTIAGPWPSYSQFKGLPERERWTLYELAKAGRLAMEDKGFRMAESYEAFVKRVCNELEI